MNRQIYGFGHGGIDGGPDDRECKPGCRFYSQEGRIETIKVLHYYEKYQEKKRQDCRAVSERSCWWWY